jgi:hypothetical protein
MAVRAVIARSVPRRCWRETRCDGVKTNVHGNSPQVSAARAERIADAPHAHAAFDLARDPALLEHDDRGNVRDLEMLGELRCAVDVDPPAIEDAMVSAFLQNLLEERLDTAARPGSRGVEVEQFGFGDGRHADPYPAIRL